MDDLGSFNASEREHIQDVLDDALDTPETKRRRWEEEEMRTPEYARTPVLREQRRQWLEDRRNRYKPTQNERTKKKSTVSDVFDRCDDFALKFRIFFNSRGPSTSDVFGKKHWAMRTRVRASATRPTRRDFHR